MIPREIDVIHGATSGLSFSTIPKKGAAMTTIEAVNATGVLYAVQDGITHVSIYPVGTTLRGWRDAGTSGLGISMAMMGAGPISQMVVGFVGDTLSGIANGEGVLESVANAAVGCAIGAVTDYAFGIDAGDFASRKEDFDVELDYIHKKYNDMGQIAAMPEIISASQKNYSIKKKFVKNYATTYEISYGTGRMVDVCTPSRIIGRGRSYDPKTGLKRSYAILENGKRYYY